MIHLSKPIKCTTPRVSLNVNSGLWVITCQCGFISYNKCTTLVWDVDSGGGCACVGIGSIWEIAVVSTYFCCEPKSALNIKSIKKKKKIGEGGGGGGNC